MYTKVLLENGWNSKRMITEGDAAIPLETNRRAFSNQEKSKQRSALVSQIIWYLVYLVSGIQETSMSPKRKHWQ